MTAGGADHEMFREEGDDPVSQAKGHLWVLLDSLSYESQGVTCEAIVNAIEELIDAKLRPHFAKEGA